MLLELLDGGIEEIYTDKISFGGCETCDYGSSYINELEIKLTTGTLKCEVDQMYEYALSEDYLMKLFLQNVEEIRQKTEEAFLEWFKGKVTEDVKTSSWLDDTKVRFDFQPPKRERVIF